jgi:hypothetical protein
MVEFNWPQWMKSFGRKEKCRGPDPAEQSAAGDSPSLPRIGGMATMPSRWKSLRIALPHILNQVDRLYLYLDKYSAIPDEITAEKKIIPLLPGADEKSLTTSGKFACLKIIPEPFLFFGFDDDIIYPPGYVNHMASALFRHNYRTLVGIHANIYPIPCSSYVRKRKVLHFKESLRMDCVVDELGTGTVAFHSRCISMDPDTWVLNRHADLMLMIEALRQQVPRIAVRRPWRFLRPIKECQRDSVYVAVRSNDSVETRLLQKAMADYPGRWCMSD